MGEDEVNSLPMTAETAEGAGAGRVGVPSGAEVFGTGPRGATTGLGPALGGRGARCLVLFSEMLLSISDVTAPQDPGSKNGFDLRVGEKPPYQQNNNLMKSQ